jgi:hypothetical protein
MEQYGDRMKQLFWPKSRLGNGTIWRQDEAVILAKISFNFRIHILLYGKSNK